MKRIIQIALLTAMLCVLTMIVSIPVGYGFVNLSDFFIMIIAAVLPIKFSFLIAGIGCSMADLLLGFGQYAIFTFIIKSGEAFLVYKFKNKNIILSFVLAGCFMMTAYAFTDVILTGSFYAFWPSLVYNATQAAVSIILASATHKYFGKILLKLNK